MRETFKIDGLALSTYEDTEYIPEPCLSGYPVISPYEHQVQSRLAIASYDKFIIQNTSPTGGGKTYSWSSPSVQMGLNVLVMYPTNALLVDQHKTFSDMLAAYYPDEDVNTLTVNAETLSEWVKDAPEQNIRKADVLDRKLKESFKKHEMTVMFTNPDVFTLIRTNKYGPEVRELTNQFDMAVFDEFHLADMKGKDITLYLLDEMHEQGNLDRIMLLSATLEDTIKDRLRKSFSLPLHVVNCKTSRTPLSEVITESGELEDGFRSIMPMIDIEFRDGNRFSTVEDLLSDERREDTFDFCSAGRTVVMMDSKKEVEDMYDALSERFPEKNIFIIDGLHNRNIGEKLDTFDILVSNKAVEAGVDFETDQVLFSGYSKESLLQRIGRLRSHSGAQEVKRAICYVEPDVATYLEKANRTRQLHGGYISRARFEDIIEATAIKKAQPKNYTPIYSSAESYNITKELAQEFPSDFRHSYFKSANKRIHRHFMEPYGHGSSKKHAERMIKLSTSKVVENTLKTFRGSGISTMLYNTKEDRIQTYGLNPLLSSYDVEFLPKSEFVSRVKRQSGMSHKQIERSISQKEGHSVGYCLFYGRRTFPPNTPEEDKVNRKIRFLPSAIVRHQLAKPPSDPEREPVVTKGLQITIEDDFGGVSGLDVLNEYFAESEVTCFVVEGKPYDLKIEYQLDDFFFMNELTGVRGEYSIAIGLNALYLHCHDIKYNGLKRHLDGTQSAMTAPSV